MNTSSTSLLRTSITAAPRRRARRPMESVSASIAPYWMSSIASRSARRSTAASTSCRLTSMPGWLSTTICGLIKAAGASARPRCRLFLTHYHWRRRNSWLLDHCRQNTLPQTANTACQVKSELTHIGAGRGAWQPIAQHSVLRPLAKTAIKGGILAYQGVAGFIEGVGDIVAEAAAETRQHVTTTAQPAEARTTGRARSTT